MKKFSGQYTILEEYCTFTNLNYRTLSIAIAKSTFHTILCLFLCFIYWFFCLFSCSIYLSIVSKTTASLSNHGVLQGASSLQSSVSPCCLSVHLEIAASVCCPFLLSQQLSSTIITHVLRLSSSHRPQSRYFLRSLLCFLVYSQWRLFFIFKRFARAGEWVVVFYLSPFPRGTLLSSDRNRCGPNCHLFLNRNMFVSSIKNWWSKKRPNSEGNDAPVTKQPGKEDEEEEDESSSQRFVPLLSLVWLPVFRALLCLWGQPRSGRSLGLFNYLCPLFFCWPTSKGWSTDEWSKNLIQ